MYLLIYFIIDSLKSKYVFDVLNGADRATEWL